jgi:hypothetical protein
MLPEPERCRLIELIANVLRDESMPEEARRAGLTLIGWLARRMPGEHASDVGVREMCEAAAAFKPSR